MKPSAVLLIDLENFYISREDYCRSGPLGYDRARFAHDLDKLLGFVRAMTADRTSGLEMPFTVKRAYADFNAARYLTGAAPQYYLRQLPDELLQQGVEPVQVFRLSRGGGGRGSKNAADMRMAMDATALLASAGHVEHFILVTGDADFIPVILELKRHGHTVSVIGVTGATSPKIQRFVDNFELFEDLIAAGEVEARTGELALTGDGIALIAAGLRRLLTRTHPLRFAAVKPLLTKELGHAFDPGVFGCDTTGEFLRNHQAELGVVIRQGQHDYEIDLPGANGSNGTGGSRVTPKPAARQPEKPPNGKPPAIPAEPHTRAYYQHLLAGRGAAPTGAAVKVPAVPWPVLVWGCDAAASLLAPPAGEPTHTTSLLPKLLRAADASTIPDLVKHLRTFYPTLRAGLPVQGSDGVYALPEGTTGEQIRRSVLGYVAYVLRSRLAEGGIAGEIRAEPLAAVFDPGASQEQAAAEVAAALIEPPAPPAPRPAAPRPAANVEEMHTPAGYMKLLKLGGPKGSDTESFKVLPVPWASVERVCADAFPLLCPGAGGGPLPREQLNARLAEAGKELFIEHYAQHVRRTLGILRVAGDLTEADGVIGLSADVSSAPDLRNRALAFLLQLLQLRLEERAVHEPIRAQAFVAALEAGPLSDRLLEEVVPAIEWLYKPDSDEMPEGVPEPACEVTLDPAEAEAVAPGPDSGVVSVGELVGSDPGPEPDRAPVIPGPGSVVLTNSEPTWDPYAFDGSLPNTNPDGATGESPPAAHVRTTPEWAPQSGADGVVDVAVITREAVAASGEDPHQSEAPKPVPPPVSAPCDPSAISEAEPFAFAPPVEPGAAGAPDEEILTAVPVADWVSDSDPLFPGVDPIPHPAGDGRAVHNPPPAEVGAAIARISLPPAAVRHPPSEPPPPPPETA